MSDLIFATPRNGLPEEMEIEIKILDLIAEANPKGCYVVVRLAYQALLSAFPILGGSNLRTGQREPIRWRADGSQVL